jgi:predicted transcriptional regulator
MSETGAGRRCPEPVDRANAPESRSTFQQRLEELKSRQDELDNARRANVIAWNKIQHAISREIAQLESEMNGVTIQ